MTVVGFQKSGKAKKANFEKMYSTEAITCRETHIYLNKNCHINADKLELTKKIANS